MRARPTATKISSSSKQESQGQGHITAKILFSKSSAIIFNLNNHALSFRV
jgi:hypothetical protein